MNFVFPGRQYFDSLNEIWILLLNAKQALNEKIHFLEKNQTASTLKDPIILWLQKNRFTDSAVNTVIDDFSYSSVGGNLQKLVEEG